MHLAASALTLVLLQASPTTAAAPATSAAQPPAPAEPVPASAAPAETPVQPVVESAPTPAPAARASAAPAEPPTASPYYYYPVSSEGPPSGASSGASGQVLTPLPEPEPSVPASSLHRKLVFANFYALSFSVLSRVPSGDVSFFLGTNLRPRRAAAGFDWNTALGYQLTVSLGGVDRASLDAAGDTTPKLDAVFVHRHHLMAMGYGGRNQRLFYSYGGGAWFNLTQLAGVEAEGRLGYVFAHSEARRLRGIVGAQGRLSGAFEGPPLLHVGLFAGLLVF